MFFKMALTIILNLNITQIYILDLDVHSSALMQQKISSKVHQFSEFSFST